MFYVCYVCDRHDLSQVTGQVKKDMSNHGKGHWDTIKWIFTYLLSISDYELIIGCIKSSLILGFDDSDYARDLNNKKFTITYVFTLTGGHYF